MLPTVVYATTLDDLSGGSSEGSSTESRDSGDKANMSDYLSNIGVTDKEMEHAGTLASPFVSLIGTATGFVMLVAAAAIFLITAIDLLYIGIPPLRSLLNPATGVQGQRGVPESGLRRRWVSDEALAALVAGGVSVQQPSNATMGGTGTMPGVGTMPGMGGMQGMPMGGMQSQPQAQTMAVTKSVMGIYLRKRFFFIVLFGVASVLLLSSSLMGFGLNLGELLVRVVDMLTGKVGNIKV